MDADFAAVGRLLANSARSAMLGALLDGAAMTAGDLARAGGVSASTASAHLADLRTAGMITVTTRGRQRYYELASPAVADALEALAQITKPVTPPATLRAALSAEAFRNARTCYDHLAGRLGVRILDALVDSRWLTANSDSFTVTDEGTTQLTAAGIDVTATRRLRRPLTRACQDWTEQRPHLGGTLGAALTTFMFDHELVTRTTRRRDVRVTNTGHRWLKTTLGLTLTDGSD